MNSVKRGEEGDEHKEHAAKRHTSNTPSHYADNTPCNSLKEIIGARHQGEAITVRYCPLSRVCWAEIAQRQMCVEI
jgi:hypothetical protein